MFVCETIPVNVIVLILVAMFMLLIGRHFHASRLRHPCTEYIKVMKFGTYEVITITVLDMERFGFTMQLSIQADGMKLCRGIDNMYYVHISGHHMTQFFMLSMLEH